MPPLDPYHRWLGIPPEEQPATLYRLLGIGSSERDVDVIRSAAARQSMHIRSESGESHKDVADRVLDEIQTACDVLCDPSKRLVYELGIQQASQASRKAPAKVAKKRKSRTSSGLSFLNDPDHADEQQADDAGAPDWLQSARPAAAGGKAKGGGRPTAADGPFAPSSSPSYQPSSRGSPAPFVAVALCMILGAIGYFVFAYAPVIEQDNRKPIVASDLPTAIAPANSNPVEAVKPVPPVATVAKPTPSFPPSPRPSQPQVAPAEPLEPLEPGEQEGEAAPNAGEPATAVDEPTSSASSHDPPADEAASSVAASETPSSKSSDPAETPKSGGDSATDRNKDFIRYKGQDMSIADFRGRCAYVDETNFTSFEAEASAFIEAKLGRASGDVQLMSLRRHNADTPLQCEFKRQDLPDRLQRTLKENRIVWAYGWFTDAPTGENVFLEDRARFEERGETEKLASRKRSFRLVATGPVDVKTAMSRLGVTPRLADPMASIDRGQSVEVFVDVTNPTASTIVDVEINVMMSFASAFTARQIVDQKILDFERIPPKHTVTKSVTLNNRVGAAFIPKVRAETIHAVAVKE